MCQNCLLPASPTIIIVINPLVIIILLIATIVIVFDPLVMVILIIIAIVADVMVVQSVRCKQQ